MLGCETLATPEILSPGCPIPSEQAIAALLGGEIPSPVEIYLGRVEVFCAAMAAARGEGGSLE
jgi:hypothetical protein